MSWQNQEVVYVVMYQSPKSGGTYTHLIKTQRGLERYIRTLIFLGYKEENIIVTEQRKAWKPDTTKFGKRKKQNPVSEVLDNGGNTLHH